MENIRCDFLKKTLGDENFMKNTKAILAGQSDAPTPNLFTILGSVFTDDTTADKLPYQELEEFSQLMKENTKNTPNEEYYKNKKFLTNLTAKCADNEIDTDYDKAA
jgi:hypothetical protein